jgi:hypothetical protein
MASVRRRIPSGKPTRWGLEVLYARLRLEGQAWHPKRILRLNLPRRAKPRVCNRLERLNRAANGQPSVKPMTDSRYSGGVVRTLSIFDDYHRQANAIEIDALLPAARVADRLPRALTPWRPQ